VSPIGGEGCTARRAKCIEWLARQPQWGSTIWTQIHLATNKNPLMKITKQRESKMNWYYNQNGGGMYMKPLTDSDCPMYIEWMTSTGNFTSPKGMAQMIKPSLASIGFTRPIRVKLKQQTGMKITNED
jgi:hypothetical protein